MRQSDLLPLIRRWWLVVAFVGFLTGIAGYLLASRATPIYESTVTLLTGPVNTDFDTQRAAGQLARTYSELAMTGPLLEAVAEEVGIPGGAGALEPKINVTASTVTRLITVIVEDERPRRAADTATAVSLRLIELQQQDTPQQASVVDQLVRRPEIADLPVQIRDNIRAAAAAVLIVSETGRLRVVDPAEVPTDPVGPNTELITVLAALLGLLVAGIVLVLRDILQDRVDSEDRLAELAPFPYLGQVGTLRPGRVSDAVMSTSSTGDRYRVLATKLGLRQDPPRISRIVVTGADGDVGDVAAGLAVVVANAGVAVMLVDADTARNRLAALLGGKDAAQPPALHSDNSTFDDAAIEQAVASMGTNLGLLEIEGPGASKLHRATIESLLESIGSSGSKLIVVAAPPVRNSSTGLEWVEATDACLLVVPRRHTPAVAVSDAVQVLNLGGANVAGVVLMEGRRRRHGRRPRQVDAPAATGAAVAPSSG